MSKQESVDGVFAEYRREMRTGRTMELGDLLALENDVRVAMGGEAEFLPGGVPPVRRAVLERREERRRRREVVAPPVVVEAPPDPTEDDTGTEITGGELASLYTYDQLMDLAQDHDIQGRSSMNKRELAEALAPLERVESE